MSYLPVYISILFVITTLLTLWQFYNAAGKAKAVLIIILVWMLIQAMLGLSGFYQVNTGFPPRFLFLIGPSIVLMGILFLTKKGQNFVDTLNIQKLTLLHAIRVPVEITLFYVYMAGLIPVLMTFEGNNFDIISGITAPIIFYLVFVSKKLGVKALLVWNFACLGLLTNIVTIALLSAQTPFQQLAFDQPNIGVTYFPLVWLPSVVVPLVMVAHLAAIRQLMMKPKN